MSGLRTIFSSFLALVFLWGLADPSGPALKAFGLRLSPYRLPTHPDSLLLERCKFGVAISLVYNDANYILR